ncbi:MAG: NnrS family protein [Pseudohongiella sp.]|nr:NnrS family protein [Pseudohongiella sp.]
MKTFVSRLFSFAFRPFFLLGFIYSISAIILWVFVWNGDLLLEWSRAPIHWHAHDMMMGLMAAAIAGFILTAVANWTSRPPVAGWPLAALAAVWLLGRLAILSPALSALGDALFWSILCLLVARELISARNKRNYKVLGLLVALSLTDMLFHAGELQLLPGVDLQRVLWAQLWLVIVLINVVGGRIVPAFTGNWLRRRAPQGEELSPASLPSPYGRVDQLAIALLLLFVASVIFNWSVVIAIPLGFSCFVAQAWRLLRWKFWLTLSDPLVWMMHLSYAWLVTGILLWTLSLTGFIPVSAAVHALTIGAITSMIISVGARAALGHTGRVLKSHYLLTTSIILLSLAALTRIAASVSGGWYWLEVAAVLWFLALMCFAVRYIPILIGPSK